jgi:hypothetical protein
MKVTVEIDCTPEEARRLLGLPDVVPMQEAMMEKIQQHVAGAIDTITPEALLRLWMPMSPDQMQQAFAKLFDTFRPKQSKHGRRADGSCSGFFITAVRARSQLLTAMASPSRMSAPPSPV